MTGLLIVNADDLGGHRVATDRALSCFEAGRITSATAMVFMADSTRAAALAVQADLPVGLHLNLTQRFDGRDVPPEVVRRQERLVAYMSRPRGRRYGFAPHLIGAIRATITDQFTRFRELYASEPTHVDGHNHAHLNPTVFPFLPRQYAVRPGHDRTGRVPQLRLPQRLRAAALARRFETVDHFFSLDALSSDPSGTALDRAFTLATTNSVEIMVHPASQRAFELLGDSEWGERLAGVRLGSYRDLISAKRG